MKKFIYIIIFLILGYFLSLELYRRSKSSLEYSVLQIILAIRNKNEVDFKNYVDIDQVVHLAVDDFVREKERQIPLKLKSLWTI